MRICKSPAIAQNYGDVFPLKADAVEQWMTVLFVAGRELLSGSIDSPACFYAVAFGVAPLVCYAILVGLRTRHLVLWSGALGQDPRQYRAVLDLTETRPR